MTQFVFKHPNAINNFVNDYGNILFKQRFTKNIYVQIKSTNLEKLNIITSHTTLPLVLIEIIDSYLCDKFNLHIIQKFVEFYYDKDNDYNQQIHCHFLFYIKNACINFNTYSFDSACCIEFKRDKFNCTYDSSSKLYIHNNDVFKYDVCDYARCVPFAEYRELLHKETDLKSIFNNHDKLFTTCRTREYDNYDLCTMPDANLFFNCFSENSQQNYNKIECYSPCITMQSDPNIKMYRTKTNIIEDCKYDKDSDSYKHGLVDHHIAKLARYKIIDHEKLTIVIAINKLLFETVNTLMKQICDDHQKVKHIIQKLDKNI